MLNMVELSKQPKLQELKDAINIIFDNKPENSNQDFNIKRQFYDLFMIYKSMNKITNKTMLKLLQCDNCYVWKTCKYTPNEIEVKATIITWIGTMPDEDIIIEYKLNGFID